MRISAGFESTHPKQRRATEDIRAPIESDRTRDTGSDLKLISGLSSYVVETFSAVAANLERCHSNRESLKFYGVANVSPSVVHPAPSRVLITCSILRNPELGIIPATQVS